MFFWIELLSMTTNTCYIASNHGRQILFLHAYLVTHFLLWNLFFFYQSIVFFTHFSSQRYLGFHICMWLVWLQLCANLVFNDIIKIAFLQVACIFITTLVVKLKLIHKQTYLAKHCSYYTSPTYTPIKSHKYKGEKMKYFLNCK